MSRILLYFFQSIILDQSLSPLKKVLIISPLRSFKRINLLTKEKASYTFLKKVKPFILEVF